MAAPTNHLTYAQAGAQITRDDDKWGSSTVGTGVTVSYGFRPTTQFLSPSYEFQPGDLGTHQEFNALQKAQAEIALRLWSDLANINFVFEEPGSGPIPDNPDIYMTTYFDPEDAGNGFAFGPDHVLGGDVWIDTSVSGSNPPATRPDANMATGTALFRTLIHEIGHAIGLMHPGDYNAEVGVTLGYDPDGAYVQDTRQFSLMSYFSETFTGANYMDVAPSTPLLHDIAAIQRLYGANMSTRTTDSTYGFNSNLGGVYALTAATGPRVWAIWDAGGVDTLDFSGYSMSQTIYLQAAGADQASADVLFSSTGGLSKNLVIAPGVTIERAIGGSGADTIWGNAAANYIDGGQGNDNMSGGLGADTYVVRNAGDTINDGTANGGIDSGSTDIIIAAIDIDLGNYVGIENATAMAGVTDVDLDGDANVNRLSGNEFANELFGAGGLDTLDGKGGNDTYYILTEADDNDIIIETEFNGYDTVKVRRESYTLQDGPNAHIEELINERFDDGTTTLTGNAFANTLIGNFDVDILNGAGGDDWLVGGGGADQLNGGIGYDTAKYIGSAGVTAVITPTGNPALGTWIVTGPAEASGDTLTSIEGFLFGNGSDNVTLAAATGAARVVTIDGGGGNDVIWGNADVEILIGGDGMDYLRPREGSFQAFGGERGETAGSWIEDAVDNDLLYLDRSTYGSNYNFSKPAGYLLWTGSDGATARGITRINFLGNDFSNNVDGGDRGDVLRGMGGSDVLMGRLGNDILEGGDGYDTLWGGEGNDTLRGGAGSDTLIAEGGNDTLETGADGGNAYGGIGNDTLTGGEQNDVLNGDGDNDIINGFGGADTLDGGSQNDTINGGLGDDWIYTGTGADTVDGGDGFDKLIIDHGIYIENETFVLNGVVGSLGTRSVNMEWLVFTGGSGFDQVTGGAEADQLYGGAGNDTLQGLDGKDVLKGEGGDDILRGGLGTDTLWGGSGDDRIETGSTTGTSDIAIGEAGDDTLIGGAGFDQLYAGDDNDWLEGFDSGDTLHGENGNDTLIGGNGNDGLVGGFGDDNLRGGADADGLNGGDGFDFASYYYDAAISASLTSSTTNTGAAAGDTYTSIEHLSGSNIGNDILEGNSIANKIYGNGGNDIIRGLDGDDLLRGGLGNDVLTGGVGADSFQFDTELNASTNKDTISSLSSIDKIILDNDIFTALGTAFSIDEYRSIDTGSSFASVDASDNIIYLKSTGQLFYDRDGSGTTYARVLFADLTANTVLNFGQILMVE